MRIIVDKKFKVIRENMAKVKVDRIANRLLNKAGREIANVMKRYLARHDYTGALSGSVEYKVIPGRQTRVEIEPKAKRGRYSAGSILQHGTRNAAFPFEPIRRWAEFRGLPAGPVWMSMRQKGLKAHNWLPMVATDSQTRGAINELRQDLGQDVSLQILGLQRRE